MTAVSTSPTVSPWNPANLLTFFRILATPFVIWLAIASFTEAAFVLYIIVCLTDYFDGVVARNFGYQSVLGKLLDPLADKVIILAMIGLVYGSGVMFRFGALTHLLTLLIVFREVVVTVERWQPSWNAFKKGSMPDDDPLPVSPFGKLKTMTQMVAFGFLIAAGDPEFEELAKGAISLLGERDLGYLGWQLYLIAGAFTVMSGLDHLSKFKLSRRINTLFRFLFFRRS